MTGKVSSLSTCKEPLPSFGNISECDWDRALLLALEGEQPQDSTTVINQPVLITVVCSAQILANIPLIIKWSSLVSGLSDGNSTSEFCQHFTFQVTNPAALAAALSLGPPPLRVAPSAAAPHPTNVAAAPCTQEVATENGLEQDLDQTLCVRITRVGHV